MLSPGSSFSRRNMSEEPGSLSLGDYLNGLQSGSSGRSSVSLNSLLSEYLQEMQQLADGTLLPKGATEGQLSVGKASLFTVQCLRIVSPSCLHPGKLA